MVVYLQVDAAFTVTPAPPPGTGQGSQWLIYFYLFIKIYSYRVGNMHSEGLFFSIAMCGRYTHD